MNFLNICRLSLVVFSLLFSFCAIASDGTEKPYPPGIDSFRYERLARDVKALAEAFNHPYGYCIDRQSARKRYYIDSNLINAVKEYPKYAKNLHDLVDEHNLYPPFIKEMFPHGLESEKDERTAVYKHVMKTYKCCTSEAMAVSILKMFAGDAASERVLWKSWRDHHMPQEDTSTTADHKMPTLFQLAMDRFDSKKYYQHRLHYKPVKYLDYMLNRAEKDGTPLELSLVDRATANAMFAIACYFREGMSNEEYDDYNKIIIHHLDGAINNEHYLTPALRTKCHFVKGTMLMKSNPCYEGHAAAEACFEVAVQAESYLDSDQRVQLHMSMGYVKSVARKSDLKGALDSYEKALKVAEGDASKNVPFIKSTIAQFQSGLKKAAANKNKKEKRIAKRAEARLQKELAEAASAAAVISAQEDEQEDAGSATSSRSGVAGPSTAGVEATVPSSASETSEGLSTVHKPSSDKGVSDEKSVKAKAGKAPALPEESNIEKLAGKVEFFFGLAQSKMTHDKAKKCRGHIESLIRGLDSARPIPPTFKNLNCHNQHSEKGGRFAATGTRFAVINHMQRFYDYYKLVKDAVAHDHTTGEEGTPISSSAREQQFLADSHAAYNHDLMVEFIKYISDSIATAKDSTGEDLQSFVRNVHVDRQACWAFISGDEKALLEKFKAYKAEIYQAEESMKDFIELPLTPEQQEGLRSDMKENEAFDHFEFTEDVLLSSRLKFLQDFMGDHNAKFNKAITETNNNLNKAITDAHNKGHDISRLIADHTQSVIEMSALDHQFQDRCQGSGDGYTTLIPGIEAYRQGVMQSYKDKADRKSAAMYGHLDLSQDSVQAGFEAFLNL